MASYQYDPAKKTARIHFRYDGRQLNRVEKVESERHAQRLVALVEETLIDLERGKLVMPPDVDAKTFILTGGKVEKRPRPVADPLQAPAPAVATIGGVFDTYNETLTPGSKEANCDGRWENVALAGRKTWRPASSSYPSTKPSSMADERLLLAAPRRRRRASRSR